MITQTEVDAGVCGFQTRIAATCEDGQNVTFAFQSGCQKIGGLGQAIMALGPVDAYSEIDPNGESLLLRTARQTLCGCCAGCAVPVALFKAMQVAAGLALPKEIHIHIGQE